MAIFVLLRFSYSETGPFLRPAAARRAGRPACGTTCIESSGGAPELLPVLRGEDEHACGSSRVFRQRDTRYRRDACGAPAGVSVRLFVLLYHIYAKNGTRIAAKI